jgi:hypothetical protein
MVFGFDDIADASILGVAWIIFTSLFPETAASIATSAEAIEPVIMDAMQPEIISSVTMPVELTQGSSIVLIQDLLGDEGLEAAVDIASGDFKHYENLPVGQKELDMAEQVIGRLIATQTVESEPGLINAVGKIITSVSQKIAPDSQGFRELILDIVKPLLQNPGETMGKLTAVGATVGAVGTFGYGALQKIKGAFDKDENLPKDIQQKLVNNQTASEDNQNLQSATDQVIGNLPMTIF